MPAVRGRHQPPVGRRLEGLAAWRRRINWLARMKVRNAEIAALRAAGFLRRGDCCVTRAELEAARERQRIAERGGMSSRPEEEGVDGERSI